MIKRMNYKSTYIEIEKENGKVVTRLISPQDKKETQTFDNEKDAEYWAVSRAEYFDRLPYAFRY